MATEKTMDQTITLSPELLSLPELFQRFDAGREARKEHFFKWYDRTHPLGPNDNEQEMAWLFNEKRTWARITDEELAAHRSERQARELARMEF